MSRSLAQLRTLMTESLERNGENGDGIVIGREFVVATIGDLHLLRCPSPTEQSCSVYEPLACLIVQGDKEMMFGDRTVIAEPGTLILASHDVPIRTRVASATENKPYLALIVPIDTGEIRTLASQMQAPAAASDAVSALALAPADEQLITTFERSLRAAKVPEEAAVLGPLLKTELHFRLLTSSHGTILRQLADPAGYAQRIATALAEIRRRFRDPIPIGELASIAGLSTSSFHQHFKDFTGTTPLQFQKDLRLIEARRDMATDPTLSIGEAAFRVGYRSPTQFSREYTRKFGVAPSKDTFQLSAN